MIKNCSKYVKVLRAVYFKETIMPYVVDEQEKEWLYSLKPSDITRTFLTENFASHDGGKPPKKEFTASFQLEAGKLGNKETIRTTVGRYIINLLFFEGMRDKVEYVNFPFDKKGMGKFMDTLSTKLIEDEINIEEYKQVLNRANWLGYSTVIFTAPAFTDEDLICPPRTAKLREELFKKYAKELEENNIVIAAEIEKQLVASAKEELTKMGSPLMDYFNSGARGKFENNYKNMTLMRGIVPEFGKSGKYRVGLSNLIDGTSEQEQGLGANILIEAASGRALETARGGYLSKQIMAAFQGVELDVEGSDCGTKLYMPVLLTDDNYKEYMYSYIFDNSGNTVLLNSKNIKNFIGKEIKWRNPMFCQSKKYCEHCYGRLPYILGMKNVGLQYNGCAEKLKNLSLKAFHDMTVKLTSLDLRLIIKRV